MSKLRGLPRYFIASCAGLATDTALLVLLKLCGLPYLLAACLSFTAGGVVVYRLCLALGLNGPDAQQRPLELLVFVLLGAVGCVVNVVVIGLAVELLHTPLLVGKAAAACCTFFTNYILRRQLVFNSEYRAAASMAERGLP